MNKVINVISSSYLPLLLLLTIVVNGKVIRPNLRSSSSVASDTSTVGLMNDNDPNDLFRMTNDDIIRTNITLEDDEYTVSTSTSRNLQNSRTILPLRVTLSGVGAPTVSKDDIYARIFSDGASFKHQVARCSGDMLQFNPTNWGVMDVYVNANWGTSRDEIINQATSVALSTMNQGYTDIRNAANHVMFILPNLNDGYVGSAEVCNLGMSCTSQFGDDHGTALTVVMHELGHNLGLKHAAGDGNEYGDKTSNMGVSSAEIGGPLSCYNAANHWLLGWFPDSRLDLTTVPSNPITVNIPAFVDYSDVASSSDQYVIVKAGNFYLQYNRAKDYNVGTRALPDKLVITWDGNPGPSGTTTLITGLDMSNANYNDGSTVAIQVCNVVMNGNVDYMVVSIGQGSTNCQAGTVSTSNAVAAQSQPVTTQTATTRSSTNTAANTNSRGSGWSGWNTWN
jgi:hypothetical protein